MSSMLSVGGVDEKKRMISEKTTSKDIHYFCMITERPECTRNPQCHIPTKKPITQERGHTQAKMSQAMMLAVAYYIIGIAIPTL